MFDVRKFISKREHRREYWFHRIFFGLGWFPASWEGWLVTLAYIGLITFVWKAYMGRVTVGGYLFSSTVVFLVSVAFLTGVLLWICWATGERHHIGWLHEDSEI